MDSHLVSILNQIFDSLCQSKTFLASCSGVNGSYKKPKISTLKIQNGMMKVTATLGYSQP